VNEFLFFFHLLLLVGFSFAALRLGSMGLIALVALQAVLANLFVVKQMTLFGFDVTCSDVFAIGGLLSLNLLQEFYGREAAQKAVKISFLSMLFFVLMAQIHLAYLPSPSDSTHGSFTTIFSSSPRIFIASIAVYFIVQQIDLTFFSWLKRKLEGRRFPLRLGISLFLSQAIDTVLFSYLGLYGLVASLFDIILVSLIVKWIAIGCSAPFTVFAKRFARVQ
jgi:hypothetical protein